MQPAWAIAQQPSGSAHRNMPRPEHVSAAGRAPQQSEQPAPVVRRPPESMPSNGAAASVSANPHPTSGAAISTGPQGGLYVGRGEHLSGWMKAHSNLSLPEQQAALEREPGFRELPPQTQQRYRDRLSELNALPPAERQRRLAYTEQMERLTPQQRTEVRSSMLQLGALPPDQKRVVMHAFHDLRGLPPEQRLAILNSRYRTLSDPQRNTLEQLMRVEPLLPADHFAENQPPQGPPPPQR